MYIEFGGGYNLDFNSQNFGQNTTGSDGNYSYEAVNGSLGKGPVFGAAFGYLFTSNFGLELGLTYKLSTELEEKDQFGTMTETTTYTGSYFAFAPTLVITTSAKGVKPYVKFGLLVAIPSGEQEYSNSEGDQGKATFAGGVDFGLTGGAGIYIPLSPNINFIAGITFVSLTWKPNEVEVVSPDGTVTIKLEDEYTSNDEFSEGPIFIPYSSVGAIVGINIAFN